MLFRSAQIKERWWIDRKRIFNEKNCIDVLGHMAPPDVLPEVMLEDRTDFILVTSAPPADAALWDADLFNGRGRAWLDKQTLPDDERAAIARHIREIDRLAEDLADLDRDIGEAVVDDPSVKRLLTITGVNVTVAAGLVAAIGDIRRFSNPQKLVSYVGLNPRVRQSGLGLAQHGRIKIGRAHV